MTAEEITSLFSRRNEAFRRHDAVALTADYATDCVIESPSFGTVFGRAAVLKVYTDWFAAFPDCTILFGDLLITGDRVVQTSTIWGTDTGGFLGQIPTGKQFRLFLVELFTFSERQIVQDRGVYDVNGLLLQLATDVGVAADTTALYRATLERARQEHELQVAAGIQRTLLPKAQHRGPGFELAAASVPCRAIGGDLFDYFDLSSGALAFTLGDIAGKGPPAALLAAVLQGILRGHAHLGGTPAETMTHVNEVLVRRAVEARFATVLYGVLACDGRLTYSNAGHNPPLLVGRRGVRRLERGGLILGAFEQATYEEETLQLDPGDVLVVFSDGITEALNADGAEFGEERLLSCLKANHERAPAALLECLLDAVHQFVAGAVQSDDLTALVLRYSGA